MWDDLPHTVSWRRKISGSEWEGDGYADPETIPARIERRTRVRQTGTGDARVDETKIMVGAGHAVTENDTLGGDRVEAVDEQVDVDGKIVGYIAYIEV